jgi:hypothetical protein
MKGTKRTLYECSHALVSGNHIRCCRGHPLLPRIEGGVVEVKRLARGNPLVFKVCQKCPDFDCMGPPIRAEERGWVK